MRKSNPIKSVIAIPSMGDHPFSVWQEDPRTKTYMWLRDNLPGAAEGIKVFLYGYDFGGKGSGFPPSIQSIALSLIEGLHNIGRSSAWSKPALFLAHGLGGIVLRQCLFDLGNAGKSKRLMLEKVKTCVFIAVPNRLPNPQTLRAMCSDLRLQPLLRNLQESKNVEFIQSLNKRMQGIAQANEIRLCSGYEVGVSKEINANVLAFANFISRNFKNRVSPQSYRCFGSTPYKQDLPMQIVFQCLHAYMNALSSGLRPVVRPQRPLQDIYAKRPKRLRMNVT